MTSFRHLILLAVSIKAGAQKAEGNHGSGLYSTGSVRKLQQDPPLYGGEIPPIAGTPIKIDFGDSGSGDSSSANAAQGSDTSSQSNSGRTGNELDSEFVNLRFDGLSLREAWNIPPDPNGAAGTDSVVAVVNSQIEAHRKDGTFMYRTSLFDFFRSKSPTSSYIFDPKIVYDPHQDRFVVVALHTNSARTISFTFLAVSKNSDPLSPTTDDWYFSKINSRVEGSWADYPGLGVDEESIYVTANMFGGSRFRSLVWIVEKEGLYSGRAPQWGVYPSEGNFNNIYGTYQPAMVRDPNGVSDSSNDSSIGTYLVSYGYNNYLSVVRITNPNDNPSFARFYVFIGDVDNESLFDAPQLGNPCNIDTLGKGAMDASWHDGSLWVTFTLPFDGQATAYWVKVDTTNSNSLTVADQGKIEADDIAPRTHTFFPSIAVNMNGVVVMGFAASAETIYAGAYAVVRDDAIDPPGEVSATQVIRAGTSPYPYQWGSCSRNRWGDYTSVAVDPVDEDCFWVYNEYASENIWKTAWGRVCVDSDDKKSKSGKNSKSTKTGKSSKSIKSGKGTGKDSKSSKASKSGKDSRKGSKSGKDSKASKSGKDSNMGSQSGKDSKASKSGNDSNK